MQLEVSNASVEQLRDEVHRLANALDTAEQRITWLTLGYDHKSLGFVTDEERLHNGQRCARFGSVPTMLSNRWLNPDSIPNDFDQWELEAAILDALVTNGIKAWSGDGSSLVTQIATALYQKGVQEGQKKAATVDIGTK